MNIKGSMCMFEEIEINGQFFFPFDSQVVEPKEGDYILLANHSIQTVQKLDRTNGRVNAAWTGSEHLKREQF